ncbi:MAG: UvrB/UvrC motif-containing protein [Thermoguttaceae bacterium]|jgi:hypothetical protein
MAKFQDIDYILRKWPYQSGVISARLLQAKDGREVLQMRIDLGILQMESTGRPDGERPEGATTYLDYLRRENLQQEGQLVLSEEQATEIDREFFQFYHRRICWLALREFQRAVKDADHSLALMDFVEEHSPNEEWMLSHEQYRPFVLFHRTQAAALAQLENGGPEGAIEEINLGLEQIRDVYEEVDGEEQFDDDEMVQQLRELQEWLREHYDISRTLSEQLADAVASEQYELAARLRDEIDRRQTRH